MNRIYFKLIFVLVLIVSVSGCGTISTVPKTNGEVRNSLIAEGTKCSSITRVYSGVAYDFCTVHAESSGSINEMNGGNEFMLAFYGVDMIVSAISDTLMLPYTITQQKEWGTIEIQN